jgi:7-carboxy-7-deazaguanine synthase
MSETLTLKVSEIFYSPQGEGARAGSPSLFVRLQGCSAKHACYQHGIRCDTEFESGQPMAIDELAERLSKLSPTCRWIVWTGGEPLDQLRPHILEQFRQAGYLNALETSGTRPLGEQMVNVLDWIVVSPKCAEHVLRRNFATGYVWHPLRGDSASDVARHRMNVDVHELRYVRHEGQSIPEPALSALHYCLSPHSDGAELNHDNLRHCMQLVSENPRWRLSPQMHKVWRVL